MNKHLLNLCLIWSFLCSDMAQIHRFIKYATQQLIFVETADDVGGIQLYCHASIVVSMLALVHEQPCKGQGRMLGLSRVRSTHTSQIMQTL